VTHSAEIDAPRIVMVHPDDVNLADAKALAARYDTHVVGNPYCPRGRMFVMRDPRVQSARRGAAVSEHTAGFDAPVNVRLVDADGVEHPVDCAYVDTTSEGMRRWYVLAPEGSWRGVRVDVLPPRSELVFPWDVTPPGAGQP
jgi:hypothetical protein